MEGKLYLVGVHLSLYKKAAHLIQQSKNEFVTRFILIKFFLLNNKYLNKT